jgi:hypothetical protein
MPPKSAPQLAPEQIEEVKEAFNLFDVDSSGAISYKELRACMKALQIKVDKDELKKMILEVDADQSGEIEFPEFLTMMTGKMAQNDSKDEILKVYKKSSSPTNIVLRYMLGGKERGKLAYRTVSVGRFSGAPHSPYQD